MIVLSEPLREWKGKEVLIYGPTYINDEAKIGEGTQVGAFSDISRDVEIGKACNIQAGVIISTGTRIGSHIFVGPGAKFFNDKYPPSENLTPPIVESGNKILYTVIGGAAMIGPGVIIGARAVVGQGANVIENVEPNTVVVGNPARYYGTRWEFELKKRGETRRDM